MDNKIFNRGIPATKSMVISLDVLMDNVSTNNDKLLNVFKDEMTELNQIIEKDLTSTLKKEFYMPFKLTGGFVTLFTNFEGETNLVFDPHIYILSLCNALNVNYKEKEEFDGNELLKECRNKINLLGKINTPSKLKLEFPYIYQQYEDLNINIPKYKDIKRKYNTLKILNQDEKLQLKEHIEKMDNILKKDNVNPNNFNLKSFIEEKRKKYLYLSRNDMVDAITYFICNCAISLDKIEPYIDIKKLDLFVASSMFQLAKNSDENRCQSISFVLDYLNEHKDNINSDLKVFVNNLDQKIYFTRQSLLNDLVEYIKENKDIKFININPNELKGKNLSEINKIVENYSSTIKLPFKILSNPEDVINSLNDKINKNLDINNETDKEKRRENKIRILKEKVAFFEKNKPDILLEGTDTFEGYYGYVYYNGKVILEKFYKGKNSIAEDAIYVMEVEDFLKYSLISKPEIIEKSLCPRIIHTPGWEKKADKYVNSKVDLNTIERTKLFEVNANNLIR